MLTMLTTVRYVRPGLLPPESMGEYPEEILLKYDDLMLNAAKGLAIAIRMAYTLPPGQWWQGSAIVIMQNALKLSPES